MNNKRINELIQRSEHKFTLTEHKIAEFVKKNPKTLAQLTTISNLSEASGFSVGSIVRFCKKLGFEGYAEFKFFIVNNLIEIDVKNREDYLITLVDMYTSEINLMKNQINQEQVANLARDIVQSNNILIAGKNSSFVSAQQLQFRLVRNGFLAFAVQDDFTIYNNADILKTNDVLIIFSVTGYSFKDHLKIIKDYQGNGIKVYIITFNADSEISKSITQKMILPNSLFTKQQFYLDGQVLFIVFIEILLHKILLEKNKLYI